MFLFNFKPHIGVFYSVALGLGSQLTSSVNSGESRLYLSVTPH